MFTFSRWQSAKIRSAAAQFLFSSRIACSRVMPSVSSTSSASA